MKKSEKMMMKDNKTHASIYFLIARFILLLSLPMEGVKAYGDFWNFYRLAELGWPFFDIWVEFPPVFPFLSRGIYLLVSGREHAYIYLTAILFSLVQAGSIYVFQLIAEEVLGKEESRSRSISYAFIVLGLFYGWSYFDCFAVFLTLVGMLYIINGKHINAGAALALGGLVKWFPVLVLPAAWKGMERKKAARMVVFTVIAISAFWLLLYFASPTYTSASFLSQGAKGSWESIWAIIDGNLTTGNFNPAADRFDASTATLTAGNPPRIPPWMTLIFFGGIGLILLWKAVLDSKLKLTAFIGLTMTLFFIWSPGYSPQWVLYLIPLILLSFERNRSLLIALVVILSNLLEWPLMLSRGLFEYLPGLILLRTVLYLFTAVMFAFVVFSKDSLTEEGVM